MSLIDAGLLEEVKQVNQILRALIYKAARCPDGTECRLAVLPQQTHCVLVFENGWHGWTAGSETYVKGRAIELGSTPHFIAELHAI